MFSTSMGCPGGSALNKPPPIREVAAPRAHSAKLFSAPRQLIPLMIAGRAVTKRAGILRPTLPLVIGMVYSKVCLEYDATPPKPGIENRKYIFK